jgi:hypothetical protein
MRQLPEVQVVRSTQLPSLPGENSQLCPKRSQRVGSEVCAGVFPGQAQQSKASRTGRRGAGTAGEYTRRRALTARGRRPLPQCSARNLRKARWPCGERQLLRAWQLLYGVLDAQGKTSITTASRGEQDERASASGVPGALSSRMLREPNPDIPRDTAIERAVAALHQVNDIAPAHAQARADTARTACERGEVVRS